MRYIDNGVVLVDVDMIINEFNLGRSKTHRTIKKLKIKPYKLYSNRFLYKESVLTQIKEYLDSSNRPERYISNWTLDVIDQD
jgi:hypothetical protein